MTNMHATNGSRTRAAALPAALATLDQRTRQVRRFREVERALIADQGGEACLTEARRQLAGKASFLAVRLEMLEAAGLAGEAIDVALYGALADRLRRLLESLGLERRARDVSTPSLRDYLGRHETQPEAPQ